MSGTVTEHQKMLANLIIAGVNKAGSTSVFHYLESHPEVCGSIDKETCYFLPLLYDGNPGPVEEYQKQFSRCKNQEYRMEATPAYVYGGERIASAIKQVTGNVKIILILREPVDRMISFYHRKKATLQLPSSMSFRKGSHCGFRFCCDSVEMMPKFSAFSCSCATAGLNRVLMLNRLVKASAATVL